MIIRITRRGWIWHRYGSTTKLGQPDYPEFTLPKQHKTQALAMRAAWRWCKTAGITPECIETACRLPIEDTMRIQKWWSEDYDG